MASDYQNVSPADQNVGYDTHVALDHNRKHEHVNDHEIGLLWPAHLSFYQNVLG